MHGIRGPWSGVTGSQAPRRSSRGVQGGSLPRRCGRLTRVRWLPRFTPRVERAYRDAASAPSRACLCGRSGAGRAVGAGLWALGDPGVPATSRAAPREWMDTSDGLWRPGGGERRCERRTCAGPRRAPAGPPRRRAERATLSRGPSRPSRGATAGSGGRRRRRPPARAEGSVAGRRRRRRRSAPPAPGGPTASTGPAAAPRPQPAGRPERPGPPLRAGRASGRAASRRGPRRGLRSRRTGCQGGRGGSGDVAVGLDGRNPRSRGAERSEEVGRTRSGGKVNEKRKERAKGGVPHTR